MTCGNYYLFNGFSYYDAKELKQKLKHMLEWLEVRLDWTSGTTKDSCMSTALNRQIATEMR